MSLAFPSQIAKTLLFAGVVCFAPFGLQAATQVTAVTVDGETTTGDLGTFTESNVEVDGKSIALDDLLSLSPVRDDNPKTVTADVTIELLDGSTLFAAEYSVDDRNATIKLISGATVTLTTRSIRHVRLKKVGDVQALKEQWADIVKQDVKSDLLVLRKKTTKKVETDEGESEVTVEALDYLEGIVNDVSATTLSFEFQGNNIDVARGKVEGVVYYHPAGRELGDPVCNLETIHGSMIGAKEFKVTGESVELITVAGAKTTLSFDSIKTFDFSSGKLAYLSDMEPERTVNTAWIVVPAIAAREERFNRPRTDRTFEGSPLQLDGKKYRKGLAMQSRTTVAYRLGGKFGKFFATVGIDDDIGERGHVELVIRADSREIFRGFVAGTDEEPLNLELDVSDVQRISILVDHGEGGNAGDHLLLCDARVKK